jgi:predicted kinase
MARKDLKVKILIGIPGSGKSTYAKEFIKKNEGWVIISRDSFRYMLKNVGYCEPKIESLITDLMNVTVVKSLSRNLNVILDNTHVKESYINEAIKLVEHYADVEYMPFDVPLETCILRDKAREKTVGEDVIKRMHKDYEVLKKSFHWNPVKKKKNRPILTPNFESKLPDAVIFDIDGTIANMGNRSPYEWNKVDVDTVNTIVAEQMSYHKSKGRKVVLLSGRDGSCRELTEDWLMKNGLKYDEFYMRKENDMRKDSLIKRELYENNIKGRLNVICVYDDRLQVVKEWFSLGVFCFNVNQGLQEF